MVGFIGIMIGMFAIGLMQLILATTLPNIIADIGGGQLYSWVFSGYMLASIATIPLFSKLADIYGKKLFYLLGMGIFAGGSLYGGLAAGMEQLIIARVIQGLGAGIITPVAMAMITDMFPAQKRGNMIGIISFVQLLSNLLSPPLGSYITKQLGWHWVFFLTVGLVLLGTTLVGVGSNVSISSSSIKLSDIDLTGGLLFGGFCVLTVSFSNALSKQGQWSLSVLLFLILALAAAGLLFINERRHANPVIKVDFFRTKVIRSSIVSSILSGAIMYGLVTILPLCGVVFYQQGYRIDESKVLLVFMVGITAGMLTASRLVGKLKTKHLNKFLWIIMSISSLLMVFFIDTGSLVAFNLLSLVIGLCTGGIMATFLINSQNSINQEDRTVLSGIIQLGRYFGASIGVTVLTGMLPEVSTIKGIEQFSGAFMALIFLSVVGLINEII